MVTASPNPRSNVMRAIVASRSGSEMTSSRKADEVASESTLRRGFGPRMAAAAAAAAAAVGNWMFGWLWLWLWWYSWGGAGDVRRVEALPMLKRSSLS